MTSSNTVVVELQVNNNLNQYFASHFGFTLLIYRKSQ